MPPFTNLLSPHCLRRGLDARTIFSGKCLRANNAACLLGGEPRARQCTVRGHAHKQRDVLAGWTIWENLVAWKNPFHHRFLSFRAVLVSHRWTDVK